MAIRRLFQKVTTGFSKVETFTIRQENTVIDYRTLTYTPTKKVQFDSTGRSLLYFYKPLPFTYLTQYALYLGPIGYLGYLMKYNPFYTVFPAALPIMLTLDTWLCIRFYKRFKYLRHVVQEVYLHKDGQTVEVVFQKQFWRRIKEENVKVVFYVSNLKTVSSSEDRKPFKGNLFPQVWPIQKSALKQLKWSYIKYYLNANNYIVFPTDPNYVNSEILIAVMNGKLINTSKQNIEEMDGYMLDRVLKKEIVTKDPII